MKPRQSAAPFTRLEMPASAQPLALSDTDNGSNATSRISRHLPALAICGVLLALSACSTRYVPNIIQPYRPDIQQGNVIIESTLAQLKPGMSQEQVRFLLGSPLLVDPFHNDRWDYVFRYQKGNGPTENSRVTIHFKDNLYTHYSGQPMPDVRR